MGEAGKVSGDGGLRTGRPGVVAHPNLGMVSEYMISFERGFLV